MKKYTIEDFDKFEIIDGYINCPSGDYSSIKKFPEKCSFGDGCSFGERCRFGAGCSFGAGAASASGASSVRCADSAMGAALKIIVLKMENILLATELEAKSAKRIFLLMKPGKCLSALGASLVR